MTILLLLNIYLFSSASGLRPIASSSPAKRLYQRREPRTQTIYSLHAFIIHDMNEIGFLMRGEIIWDKGASASSSTAWGSWQSASNPTLRDTHEYILVFSKGNFRRDKLDGRSIPFPKKNFLNSPNLFGRSRQIRRKIGHPAPFPIELPYRLIELYTFKDEIVLDPFMGSGQTRWRR